VQFDDDLKACAALVQRADPDRFMAAMAAPVAARPLLFPLYALNIEVSRAPWVTSETLIAEMRLQWWRDALGEIAAQKGVRRHEVVTPLAQVVSPDQAGELDEMVSVRRWDIYRDPFDNPAHFENYIDQSSGSLMWVAARCLDPGIDPKSEAVVRDFAYAAGLANWLRAVSELRARGRIPLLDGTPQGIAALAQDGLVRMARARAARAVVSRAALPAFLVGWQAQAVLKQAARDPGRVDAGTLGQGEMRRRLSLMAQVVTGRW
jgi:phytoene/squalene synthetase